MMVAAKSMEMMANFMFGGSRCNSRNSIGDVLGKIFR